MHAKWGDIFLDTCKTLKGCQNMNEYIVNKISEGSVIELQRCEGAYYAYELEKDVIRMLTKI